MAGEETTNQGGGNIRPEFNTANTGLNLDLTVSQIPKGALTYALNASVENFGASSINYQNEPGNELCLNFPDGYQLIGEHSIYEKNKHIFFLANPTTGDSEIGYMENNDCVYRTLVNAPCLNFNIDNPIHKAVHRITNCTTEVYWTDGLNPRRYLDIDNIPYILRPNSDLCDPRYTNELNCNRLSIQPNFSIPGLEVVDVVNGGDLIAGTYQFAIQYCDASGGGYSSYYSVTNPTPIADNDITTLNFNYQVGRSIRVNITNLDVTGQWQYFNLAVIKTVNDITSVELVGTFFIDGTETVLTYSGQNQTQIRLTTSDIFEKFPYYEIAQDLTAVRDVLVWDQLTSIDRINYQQIANQITLEWESYRIPNTEDYSDELNATNLRGYLRDEVYAFEIVFLLKNGKQTDGFHIPGRISTPNDLVPVYPTNADFIGEPNPVTGTSPWWKIYNTAIVSDFSPGYSPAPEYKGPYQYGQFSYWESLDTYPCNIEVWGELANQPIRHHKFPDVSVSPIFQSAIFAGAAGMVMQKDAIFPIGVRINTAQVYTLINSSNLTQDQKDNIAAFKIVRGNRSTNRSIVAKGIVRNVGKYDREGTEYLYPNYPYNDLKPDKFLLSKSNAYTIPLGASGDIVCRNFTVTVASLPATGPFILEYIDCTTTETVTIESTTIGESFSVCTLSFPTPTAVAGTATVKPNTYQIYELGSTNGTIFSFNEAAFDITIPPTPGESTREVPAGETRIVYSLTYPRYLSPIGSDDYNESLQYSIIEKGVVGQGLCTPPPLDGFGNEESKYRMVFNSPETSFGQPFLGDILKLENVIFGAGRAHFTQVQKNAQYKFISREAQQDALNSSNDIANITSDYNASALFAAYQAYLTIYVNGITRRNYAYSFNSIASYDYSDVINNNTFNQNSGFLGVKQRKLDIAQYLIPGVQSVGDDNNINNFQRESSVYLKTTEEVGNFEKQTSSGLTVDTVKTPPLPFASDTPSINGIVTDDSRYAASDRGVCNVPGEQQQISVVSYYASIKNLFENQYGQIYSYETIDTGFQKLVFETSTANFETIFGGDTFINKFAFKTKLPFFIDNTVNSPDDRDIFFDEIGNVAYPKYWFSSRSILSDATVHGINLSNFISIKANNFDCPNSQTPKTSTGRTYYDGKMYQFAYGVPYFYCESSYNVDLRQAFNNKEGDFWPHVSNNIPDDWVQEDNVSINFDNTYYYNVTFSKQNKENFFSHLPIDWTPDLCSTTFPFRAIYSDEENNNVDDTFNNWLVYRPVSFFDFPQNYGKLVSLDGIQNRATLARFENKSLLYNTLLTIDTNNNKAAYIGNASLFESSPPVDFAETDLGYVGSQNKMLLKIPQGQVTVDAKRGQVFLVAGSQVSDLSGFGSGMNKFFVNNLSFEILNYFPNVDTDNHFTGIGLHGVYDSKYDRVILTKLDYTPINSNVKYDEVTKSYYIIRTPIPGQEIREEVYLTDEDYFCNKSWTVSYNANTKSWTSFHSYLPNYYVAENNFFYSGINDCCSTIEAIVAEVLPQPPITTTTSTSSTTTTTTTVFTGCNFTGTAQEILPAGCVFEGTAVEQYTTTTTTSTIAPGDISCFSLTYLSAYGAPTTCLGEALQISGGYYRLAFNGGGNVPSNVTVYYDVFETDGCTGITTNTTGGQTILAGTSYTDFIFIQSYPVDCPPDSPCRFSTVSLGGISGTTVSCGSLPTTTTTSTSSSSTTSTSSTTTTTTTLPVIDLCCSIDPSEESPCFIQSATLGQGCSDFGYFDCTNPSGCTLPPITTTTTTTLLIT